MKVLNIFSNPIVKFFMSVVPTVWFTFFSVFGPQNDLLMNSSNKLTALSIIINLIMIAIMFLFSLGIMIEKYVQKSISIKKNKIFNSILTGINESNNILINKQIERTELKNDNFLMSDYRSAIYTIIENLIVCLMEITEIERQNFVVTYFFKPKNSDNWVSISSDEGYKGVKQKDLIQNKESVLFQLIEERHNVFYPSKEKALNEKKYIADHRDLAQLEYKQPMGSIFGVNWNLSDSEGLSIFENIIAIATYGEEICTEKDVVTKKEIIEKVLKVYKNLFIQTAFTHSIIGADKKESGEKV